MEYITELNRARELAGMQPLDEKKLSGKAKEEFLAKMTGGDKKKSKKDDDGVDGGSGEEASKGAKKAMDDASIKGSVSGKKGVKMKKKVSEGMNEILAKAGVSELSEEQAKSIDEAYDNGE